MPLLSPTPYPQTTPDPPAAMLAGPLGAAAKPAAGMGKEALRLRVLLAAATCVAAACRGQVHWQQWCW